LEDLVQFLIRTALYQKGTQEATEQLEVLKRENDAKIYLLKWSAEWVKSGRVANTHKWKHLEQSVKDIDKEDILGDEDGSPSSKMLEEIFRGCAVGLMWEGTPSWMLYTDGLAIVVSTLLLWILPDWYWCPAGVILDGYMREVFYR
jgi:hypothetical protein